jgi:hypothetical protein
MIFTEIRFLPGRAAALLRHRAGGPYPRDPGAAAAAAARLHLRHAPGAHANRRAAQDQRLGPRDDNCVQRCRGDVHAISSHVVMNFDVAEFGLEAYRMS